MCYDLVKGETEAREILPEEDVWFWDGRVGREEGDDGVGVGGGNGGEEGRGVEGAGVEEVGGFCGFSEISNGACRCEDWSGNQDIRFGRIRVHTSAGFEGVGTKGKDVGGEAGLKECGFIARYRRDSRLGRSGHRSIFLVRFLDCSK